jgi:hypothetical protein
MRRHALTLPAAMAAAVALLAVAAAPALGATEEGPFHGDHPSTAQRDVAQVRGAVARYHTPHRAEAAGWGLVPGLDHCFDRPGAGAMGVHYIDTDALVDPTLDPLRPEALVFVPGPEGQLRLGAVEYIVPMSLREGGDEPPMVLGRQLHELEPVPGVHVWGLHVWLFQPNPNGIFADWNPQVSCGSL